MEHGKVRYCRQQKVNWMEMAEASNGQSLGQRQLELSRSANSNDSSDESGDTEKSCKETPRLSPVHAPATEKGGERIAEKMEATTGQAGLESLVPLCNAPLQQVHFS